jgi:hypothetical protein
MTHRPLLTLTLAGLALGTAGCATTARDGEPRGYAADLDRLRADCTAREGILTPTSSSTGRAETDYVCTIRGPATRLRD